MRRLLPLAVLLAAAGRAAAEEPAQDPRRLENGLYWFLVGRPDRLDGFLGTPADPRALWPLGFRDLSWRPTTDAEARSRYAQAAEGAQGPAKALWGATIRGEALPEGEGPDRILLALAEDRRLRETEGRAAVLPEGPLERLTRGTPFEETVRSFVADVRGPAYAGPEADSDASRLYDEVRPRGLLAAVAALVLFVGGTILLGLRAARLTLPGTRPTT